VLFLYRLVKLEKFKPILIVNIVFLLACTSQKVQTDYDPAAAFKILRTYHWLKPESAIPNPTYEDVNNEFISKKVRPAAEEILGDKGFELSEKENPDFLIAYYAGLKKRVNVNEYGYSYGQWQSGLYDRKRNVEAYQEGLLMIDIILGSSKELIWRGWLTGIIEDPGSAGQKIEKAVKKILDKFPPKN